MKIVKYFAMMAAVVATLASCEDPNNGPGGGQQSTLKATASATTIYADGKDAVSFSVTLDGVPVVAAEVEAYDATNDNVVAMENLTFSTTTPGVYEFYFKHGENKSNNVEITAVDAKFSKLDLSDVEGQEGLSVMATSTVFQRGEESVFIIVRKDGKVVNDANKIKFYLSGSTEEITDTDFQMVDYVDANDDLYTLPQYTPAQTGVRDIWLSYGSANTKNKPVRITAVDFAIPSRAIDTDPENTSFTSRVLVNQFTGTGCPNCPYWSSALKDLKADEQYKDAFVLAAAHTFNDDSNQTGVDKVALNSPYANMPSVFGVNTYPTIILNMSHSFGNNGRAANKESLKNFIDNTKLSAPAAGISARSNIEGSTVIARATVKAAKAGEYRVGAWLVEDDLYAPQNNTSNIFDYDFDYHEAVIRIADSNHDSGGQLRYRGHTLGELAEGQVVDYVFTMELKSHWRAENCRLVFFVTGGEQFHVVNAIETTSLNSSVEFSYTK